MSKPSRFTVLAAVAALGCMSLAVAQERETQKPRSPAAKHHAEHHGDLKEKVELPTHGVVTFEQRRDGLYIRGKVTGLSPGKHGFHIHEFGDLRDPKGESAGGHFDPEGHEHGAPGRGEHHAGDLGNIEANQDGEADINVKAPWLKLHFAIGRALVVHGGEDDLKSQPSGDAGPRVAVAVIGIAKPTEPAPAASR